MIQRIFGWLKAMDQIGTHASPPEMIKEIRLIFPREIQFALIRPERGHMDMTLVVLGMLPRWTRKKATYEILFQNDSL